MMQQQFSNKLKNTTALLLVLVLLLSNSVVLAQELVLEQILKGEVTLDEASQIELTPLRVIELLETDNLELALARMQIKESKWEMYREMSRMLPSINGGLSLEKFTGSDVIVGERPFDISRVTQRHRLAISYDFHTGFKPLIESYGAKHKIKRFKSNYNRTLQKSLLDALSQYYQWQRDISSVEVARQGYMEAVAQRKQNEVRLKTGFGTQLEVEQTTVVEMERQAELYTAESERLLSESQLASYLNIPLRYSLKPASSDLIETPFWNHSADLPELYELAKQNRPDVKVLDAMIREAKATMWSSVSDIAPTLRMGAFVGNVGPESGQFSRMFQRSVQLNFDVLRYLGLEAMTNIKTNQNKVKQAILNKENELNKIKDDLAQAYYDWQLASKKLGVERQKIHSAKEAFRIAKARKRTGIGIFLEVVQAQTKMAEAQQGYLTALMEYNNAQLQLLFETGQLTPKRVLVALGEDEDLFDPIDPVKPLQPELIVPVSLTKKIDSDTSNDGGKEQLKEASQQQHQQDDKDSFKLQLSKPPANKAALPSKDTLPKPASAVVMPETAPVQSVKTVAQQPKQKSASEEKAQLIQTIQSASQPVLTPVAPLDEPRGAMTVKEKPDAQLTISSKPPSKQAPRAIALPMVAEPEEKILPHKAILPPHSEPNPAMAMPVTPQKPVQPAAKTPFDGFY